MSRIGPLVLVRWIDSATVGSWRTLDEYKEIDRAPRISSVGWLLTENEEAVVLLQTLDAEQHKGTDTIIIPKGVILGITRLYQRGKSGQAIRVRAATAADRHRRRRAHRSR